MPIQRNLPKYTYVGSTYLQLTERRKMISFTVLKKNLLQYNFNEEFERAMHFVLFKFIFE